MGKWRGLVEVVSGAALLHDLGHVAAGHTLEDEFSILDKHDGVGTPRLFEFLYGPRTYEPDPNGATVADRAFGPIDETKLSRPASQERVPLPWLFEDETYERFLPGVAGGHIPTLTNSDIRDFIYLLLSFKERVTSDTQTGFQKKLDIAGAKGDSNALQRVDFIEALYGQAMHHISLGPDEPEVRLFEPFMSDLVSNTICADLLDYLVRDGARLKLDIRSNPRLQRYLVIRPAPYGDASANDDEKQLALRLTIYAVKGRRMSRRDTVGDLLDLMRERFRFAEVVYYHPKKCAFSSMFAKALELSPTRPRTGEGVYPSPWSRPPLQQGEVPHITHLGDQAMVSFLQRDSDQASPAARMARRIQYRDEYSLLYTLDYSATGGEGPTANAIDKLKANQDSGRHAVEKDIENLVERAQILTDLIEGEPPILLYCPQIRMQAKEVAAHVELSAGLVVPLNRLTKEAELRKEIDTLNEKYRALWRLYLFVHPALLSGDIDELSRGLFLGAAVDALFEFLPWEDDSATRARGASFDYQVLPARVDSVFREFARLLPPDAPIDAIRQIAAHSGVWKTSLAGDFPIPVTRDECFRGFGLATALVGARESEATDRTMWNPSVAAFRADDWLRTARTESGEGPRQAALSNLLETADDLVATPGRERRLEARAWSELRSSIVDNLGQSGSA